MTAPDATPAGGDVRHEFTRWTGWPDTTVVAGVTHWYDVSAMFEAIVSARAERDALVQRVRELEAAKRTRRGGTV